MKKRGDLMDNKLKIILIIAVLFIISIIINSLLKSNTEQKQSQNVQEIYKVLTCQDECSNNENCLNTCYQLDANVAVAKADLSLCNKIPNDKIKQDCKDRVNFKLAISGKKLSLCNEIIDINLKQICQNSK